MNPSNYFHIQHHTIQLVLSHQASFVSSSSPIDPFHSHLLPGSSFNLDHLSSKTLTKNRTTSELNEIYSQLIIMSQQQQQQQQQAKFLQPKIISPAIHGYVSQVGFRESAIAQELRLATAAHPYSVMMGDPLEAALFRFVLNILPQASTIVEVGVFTGYTTLVMAEALQEKHPQNTTTTSSTTTTPRIIALDVNDEFVEIGKPYWQKAGVDGMIDLRIGPALESLQQMKNTSRSNEDDETQVDFAFIDADKVNYRAYYEALVPLMRPNGIIAIDNVLWSGKVVNVTDYPPGKDADTDALRALNEFVATDERVEAVLLPIADGVTLVRKK